MRRTGGGLGLGLANSFKLEVICTAIAATDARDPTNPRVLRDLETGSATGFTTVVFKFGSRKDERNHAASTIERVKLGGPQTAAPSLAAPTKAELRASTSQPLASYDEFECAIESEVQVLLSLLSSLSSLSLLLSSLLSLSSLLLSLFIADLCQRGGGTGSAPSLPH
eukprot:SAG31_NODE_5004_length_2807_cov_1.624446_3_plen_167_part_00